MNKIRALVVDDEPMARDRVLSLLQQEQDVEVVGECGDGTQAVVAIQSQSPDLVFLDVQMPGHNAFEVIQAVGADRMPSVIFVTAYDEYALRAFEVHALDYLLSRGAYVGVALPDLIVLDLNLPKLGGRELLAEMKQHPQLQGIPVVVLTSSDADRDVVMSYKLGASCYVTKPVGLEAFQAIVKSIESFWFTVVKLP